MSMSDEQTNSPLLPACGRQKHILTSKNEISLILLPEWGMIRYDEWNNVLT